MDAEEIGAAAAAAELNILGGLASVTGLQSPAPTRPAGATANDASKDEASPIPSAPAAPSGVANDSPQGAVPATPSAVTITTEQLAMLYAGRHHGHRSKGRNELRLVFTFSYFPTNQCLDNICFSIHNN